MTEHTYEDGRPGRWIALAGICTAAGLVWLAFADLSIALPTISKELSVDLTALQWTNNAFSLACGALVLPAGRFADVYGRRRMLLLGIAIFGAFSLLTAFLSGLVGLVTGRALMGVGAALILPATLALIPPLFPRREQPTAFGVWMAVAWVGQAAGPAIGGALTSVLDWRSLFWVAAPLAVVAYVVVAKWSPESRDPAAGSAHVDILGLVTSVSAAFFLLYACTEGQSAGFSSPLIIITFVAAIVLAFAFVVVEGRLRHPMVDLRLFKARDFDGALVANLAMNIVFAGISYLFALYLQEVRGYTALQAGLLLFPSAITILALNPIGSKLSARRGPKLPVLCGLSLLALGTLAAGFVSPTSPYWLLLVGLLVLGAGLGLLSVPISDTAVAGPPEELAGTASGLFKMSSMLGGAFGVAALSAVALALQGHEANDKAQAAGLNQGQIDQLSHALSGSSNANEALSGLPESTRDAIVAAYQQAQADGTAGAVIVGAIIAAIATLIVWRLWPHRP